MHNERASKTSFLQAVLKMDSSSVWPGYYCLSLLDARP